MMRGKFKIKALYMLLALLFVVSLSLIAPLFISKDYFFTRLEAETFALMGEKLTIKGEKKIYLTPFPSLLAENITLGEGVKAKSLHLKLGAGWFLREALTSYHITLVEGEAIQISRNQNWLKRLETLAKAETSPLFGVLILKDFKFNFEGEENTRTLNAAVSWPEIKSPLVIEGQLQQDLTFVLNVSSPKALLNLTTSPMKAEVTLPRGKLKIQGDMGRESLNGQMVFEGQKLQAKSNLIAHKGLVSLEALHFSYEGQKGEGALTVEFNDKKRLITGTVSSEKWQVTPSSQALNLDKNLQIPLFNPQNPFLFDIRFSIDELAFPTHKLRHIGAQLFGTAQDMSVKLLRATFFEGVLSGIAQIKPYSYGFIGQIKNLDLSQFPTPLKMSGLADATFDLNAPALSLLEAQGKFMITSSKSGLSGINLDDMLSNFASRPLARGGFMRSLGKTHFSLFESDVHFNKGQFKVESLRLETEKIALRCQGLITLPSKRLDLNVQAQLKGGNSFALPLRIEGTLDAPSLRFDPQSLISRSKATEPLREAARDSEAVKRVLEAIGRQVPELAPLEK